MNNSTKCKKSSKKGRKSVRKNQPEEGLVSRLWAGLVVPTECDVAGSTVVHEYKRKFSAEDYERMRNELQKRCEGRMTRKDFDSVFGKENEQPNSKADLEEEKANSNNKSEESEKGRISKKKLDFPLKGKLHSSRATNTKPFNEKELFEIFDSSAENSACDSEPDSEEEEEEKGCEQEENETENERSQEEMLQNILNSKVPVDRCSSSKQSSLIAFFLRWVFMGLLAYAVNVFIIKKSL